MTYMAHRRLTTRSNEQWLAVGLVVALFAGGQVVGRWTPGYWETRGFVLCSRFQTLHRGVIYLPGGPSFKELFSLPASIGIGLSVCFAMVVLTFVAEKVHAGRVAKLLQRILPDGEPP